MKYRPVGAFLASHNGNELTMSFAELDRLCGGLPPSARRHRPWWANERQGQHVQARAWLDAGWSVAEVEMAEERVTFRRDA